MPTILASSIVDKAEIVLHDTTNVHWAAAELLGWLNDGQLATVLRRPDAYTKTVSVPLAAGSKQALPADGVLLFQVHANMGTTGITEGAAVRLVTRELLDAQNPSWRAADKAVEVEDYVYNPQTPRVFYVSPPNTGTGYVELSYSAVPPTVALAEPIAISDVYAPALIDYILFRAYSKDAKHGNNAMRVTGHYQAWEAALAAGAQNLAAHNPNVEATAFNPAVPAGAK